MFLARIIKQPAGFVLATRVAPEGCQVSPPKMRGATRRKARGVAFHAGRFGCCDSLHTRARLSARHRGGFGRRDRASGYWEGEPRATSLARSQTVRRRISPPGPYHVQPLKAEPRNGPGRFPVPPESVGASHVRRRRILPRSRTPHEAPLVGQDGMEYSHKRNVVKPRVSLTLPGRGAGRRPMAASCADPGLCARETRLFRPTGRAW